jgi:hypothetical protein
VSVSEIFPSAPLARSGPRHRPPPPVAKVLPEIAPGQLWLVEAAAVKAEPSASARHAIDGANVVIYDRALTGRLGNSLPLGIYAEPAALGDGAAVRSVRFARDGWSVVRLMAPRLPHRDRVRRVRDIVDALAAARVPAAAPVRVLAEAAYGIREETETTLDRLIGAVATFDRDTRLTIVIDAFGAAAANSRAIAANGLAG